MTRPAHPAYGVLRAVAPFASAMLCNNPGRMELDGTNTWILRAPGNEQMVVVDPGPKGKPSHLNRIAEQGPIALVLITHRHADHTGAIGKLHKRFDEPPVRAWSPQFCKGAGRLNDGEIITAAGVTITVLHTPGHTTDSVSLRIEHDTGRAMATGDTILGTGTTVLDPSGGALRDYMNSLERLITEGAGCHLLPGHGPDHPDLVPVAQLYRQHREDRINQIREALLDMKIEAAQAKPMKVVRRVYADVDKKLWPAARMSVKSQLAYLASEDRRA